MAAGLVLGATNSLTNALGSAYGPFTATPGHGVRWLEYLSFWLGSPWAWALYAFAVGWLTRPLSRAVLLATLGLLLAVVAYYVSDALVGLNDQLSVREIVLWSGISLVVGPVMAALGVLARMSRPSSLVPGLVAPATMAYFALTNPSGNVHLQPWSQVVVLGGALLLAVALVVRVVRLRLSQGGEGSVHST